MTLPHTNAGLIRRLHDTRLALLLRAAMPLTSARTNKVRGGLR